MFQSLKGKRAGPKRDKFLSASIKQLAVLYKLTETIVRGSELGKIYKAALVTIKKLLKVDKAAILLFDLDGVLRFKSWVGLSKKYRQAMASHSLWKGNVKDSPPLLISDINTNKSFLPLKKILQSENIRALGFFPLILKNSLIGKFMIYYKNPHIFSKEEIEFAQVIGKYISFVINRKKGSEDFLNAISEGITIQDATGRLIFANNVAAVASGYKSAEEMIKKPAKWIPNFELKDEKGRPFKLEDLPGRKALVKKEGCEQVIQFKNLKTGEIKWAIVKASPGFDEQGELQYVINTIHDVTERLELERRKDEFISMASHELKTPIATLKGFTQILENLPNEENTKYYLNKISDQINRISKLVEDLLDVSKIQSKKLTPVKEKFNIVDLIHEVAEDIQLVNGDHKIIVKNGIPKKYLWGDKYKIDQVVSNLLSNAIKFSPKAEKVIIETEIKTNEMVISIKDFGIGISKKNMDRIFEPFFQASSKIRQSFSGLGLGLYISSEIIKQHKGRMWVKSEKGRGSTFYFSLPIKNKS